MAITQAKLKEGIERQTINNKSLDRLSNILGTDAVTATDMVVDSSNDNNNKKKKNNGSSSSSSNYLPNANDGSEVVAVDDVKGENTLEKMPIFASKRSRRRAKSKLLKQKMELKKMELDQRPKRKPRYHCAF